MPAKYRIWKAQSGKWFCMNMEIEPGVDLFLNTLGYISRNSFHELIKDINIAFNELSEK